VGERRYLTVMFCDLVGSTNTEKLVDAFGGLKVDGPSSRLFSPPATISRRWALSSAKSP
jgi:hypothetical protein